MSTFVTDEGIEPAVLGPALEERGLTSLFVAEHTHIPVSRETPYPAGGDLPRDYYRTLDPIVLAKEMASLDLVPRGRSVLGVGAGWNREEMLDHGTDPKTRMSRMREYVLAIKEI